jgi:hypothetical protein
VADPKDPLSFLFESDRLVQRFILSEVLARPKSAARRRPPGGPMRPPRLKDVLAKLPPVEGK